MTEEKSTQTQTQAQATTATKDTVREGRNKRQPAASTQRFLKIAEIRDDLVVLKNGGIRAILRTSSINFNLKSEEEQNAIIIGYQSFLNSLEFPLQILIRSKKLDVDNYIEKIKKIGEKQKNPLLQTQTTEYAEYIQKLVEYADIMEKDFFVIVPYDPPRTIGVNFLQRFLQNLNPQDNLANAKKRHTEFEHLAKGINQRVLTAKSGLENCGLKVEQLDTSKLIELFYNTYNPEVSRNEKLKDLSALKLRDDKEQIALDQQ